MSKQFVSHHQIITAMPAARRHYAQMYWSILDLEELNGKITFCDVRSMAEAKTTIPAVVEALIRIIESAHCITLEVK